MLGPSWFHRRPIAVGVSPVNAEPEVAGLLALIRLHRARSPARFGPGG
jgi:predicted RNA polymerase sigma factor